MKRIFSLLLALVMVFELLPAVSAEALASGTCGDNLNWSIEDGILRITGSGDMYDYGSGLENDDGELIAPAPWDEYCSDIHTVLMDDSITSIGDFAFMFMENLTGLDLPTSLTSIGSHSLYGLPITEIRIPEGVVSIGEYAFGHCHDLTDVYFPSTLRSVGNAAFYENLDLKRVYIPSLESWFQIQFTSFYSTPFSKYEDTLLYVDGVPTTDIVVPENVTVIGEGQFSLYSSLTSLQLHDNITSIGDDAFDCDKGAPLLTHIIIPESVEYIGSGAFSNCSRLSDVYIMNSDCKFGEEDAFYNSNCYFDEELDETVWGVPTIHGYAGSTAEAHASEYNYPFVELAHAPEIPEGLTYQNRTTYIEISSYTGTASMLEIPETIEGLPVTSIGYDFNNCPTLAQVILPETIEWIHWCAFTDCPKLVSFYFSGSCPNYTAQDGVLYNGDMTQLFRYPAARKGSFTIPDSVTAIDSDAFDNCTGLTALTLPKNYTSRLYNYIFSYCTNLEEVTIPAGVTEIQNCAFYGCTSLTSIQVDVDNSTYSSIDGVLFNKEGTVLETFPGGISGHYIIPENVTVAYRAFYTPNQLTKLTLSSNVRFERNWGFVDSWGYVLDGCRNLTEIAVSADNSDYSAHDGILYDKEGTCVLCCPQGKSGIIEVPDGVTSIGGGSFQSCNKLTGLVLPKSLTDIYSAFSSYDPLDIYYAGTEDEWSAVYISGGPGDVDGSNYDICYNEAVLNANLYYNVMNFEDTPISAWYGEPVLWAVSGGITTGTSATTFSPGDDCMRAYVVTFLWRAAGCPEPKSAANPFVDVAPGSFYEKPVLWAVENGITNGADATHFNPAGVCNRAQIVTFLYRAFGSPAVDTNDLPFGDVPAGSWCAAPVAWAVKNEITNGLSATSFGPNTNCNRAQVVTFLYRAYN